MHYKLQQGGWRCVWFLCRHPGQIYSALIQESPTLDLVNDCFRFVTRYFEVISASSPHIYHSALILVPKKSIVWELYGSQVDPFARVVHGVLISWDSHTVATLCHSPIDQAVWSPCDRFIAITYEDAMMVDILDSVTLQRLQTLKPPDRTPTFNKTLIFSPDSHILTCSSSGYGNRFPEEPELFVISWDLQTGGVASVIKQPQICGRPVIIVDLVHRLFGGHLQRSHIYQRPTIAYLANGKKAIALYPYFRYHEDGWIISISIFNITSGICTHSHLLESHYVVTDKLIMWTEGEALRFITVRYPVGVPDRHTAHGLLSPRPTQKLLPNG